MPVCSQGVNSLGQDPHQEDVRCRVMPNMLKARAKFVHNYIIPSANSVTANSFQAQPHRNYPPFYTFGIQWKCSRLTVQGRLANCHHTHREPKQNCGRSPPAPDLSFRPPWSVARPCFPNYGHIYQVSKRLHNVERRLCAREAIFPTVRRKSVNVVYSGVDRIRNEYREMQIAANHAART